MIQITPDMIQVMFQGGSDLRVPLETELSFCVFVQLHFLLVIGFIWKLG